MQELENAVIDHYQIQRRLARGGMAEVYLAQDTETEHPVAIKLVHTCAGDYCERFRREVRAVAMLTHEHILPALDYGEFQSWYYLVTPYIAYGTLARRMTEGHISLEEAGRVLEQLGSALQFAHEQGIIHRDIKPSNVLLEDGERVYLADFGLVKRVGEDTGLTVTGFLIGTPEYMAPELAEEEATPASDMYALGVLLYQMLTGRVPFSGSTPMGTYLKHIREWPLPPSAWNAELPPAIDRVVLRALAKEPRERFRTMKEFVAAYWQATHVEEIVYLADEAGKSNEAGMQEAEKEPVYEGSGIRPLRVLAIAFLVPILLFVLPLLLSLIFSGAQVTGSGLVSPQRSMQPAHSATVVRTQNVNRGQQAARSAPVARTPAQANKGNNDARNVTYSGQRWADTPTASRANDDDDQDGQSNNTQANNANQSSKPDLDQVISSSQSSSLTQDQATSGKQKDKGNGGGKGHGKK